MSRNKIKNKHEILPDLIFESKLISKFINIVMKDGKKSIAEIIVYKSFYKLIKKTKISVLDSFNKIIDNVKPIMEIKYKKRGSTRYKIPVEIKAERKITLAMRWIIESARKRKDKSIILRLSNELWDAYNNIGESIRKKENIHKMVESNKVFSNFHW